MPQPASVRTTYGTDAEALVICSDLTIRSGNRRKCADTWASRVHVWTPAQNENVGYLKNNLSIKHHNQIAYRVWKEKKLYACVLRAVASCYLEGYF